MKILKYDEESIYKKVKIKKKIKEVLKKVILIFLVILFIFNITLLYQSIKNEKYNNILGIYVFNIISRKYGTNL